MSETLEPVTQILLQDNFSSDPSGKVSPTIWTYGTGSAEYIPSTLGISYPGTELEPYLPSVSNGALDLTLQTYNPTSSPPGTSFLGSDIISNQTFDPPAPGQGLAFTAVASLDTTVPGMDGGIFEYFADSPASHDEIDFESLTDTAAAGNSEEQTNIYADQPTNSIGQPQFVPDPSLTAYQTYTVEWFSDQVLWFIDGQLVRTNTIDVPKGPMQLDLDFWAYDAQPGTLQPTSNQALDTTYTFDVQSVSVAEIACYAAGTRIATPTGARAVETLAPGDRLLTASGEACPITWLGHRHLDCRHHPRPTDAWPVRISAGAFRPGQPRRDLFLSPDHAVFVDGVLIPIRYLINGTTIAQDARDEITYWHVALARHDVILAEGLPCESYLDTGNRSAFSNGSGIVQLDPALAPGENAEAIWESAGCAPLRSDGEAVARVTGRLRRRAVRLGHPPVGRKRTLSRQAARTTTDLAELLQPAWYLATYPDVAAAGIEAAQHYAGWGRREGRLPCPEIDLVRALDLIDPLTRAITMSDVIAAGIDPVDHFCTLGWRERRRPNLYFETGWYLDNHDVPAGMNPLLHYVLHGETQGIRPSRHFDPVWYRQSYTLEPSESAFAHYLKHRRKHRLSPLPTFDLDGYVREHAATLLPDRDPYAYFLGFARFAAEKLDQTEGIAA